MGKIDLSENNSVREFREFPPAETLVMVPLNSILEKTSLRDQMAMSVISGMMGSRAVYNCYKDMAQTAYEMADAMLRAREK